MCDQQSHRSACAYAQSDPSLCLSLEYSMIVKLLTEHHLEFLSLKGCRGSSESTLLKMPHCWKSHATAHFHFRTSTIISYTYTLTTVYVAATNMRICDCSGLLFFNETAKPFNQHVNCLFRTCIYNSETACCINCSDQIFYAIVETKT